MRPDTRREFFELQVITMTREVAEGIRPVDCEHLAYARRQAARYATKAERGTL